ALGLGDRVGNLAPGMEADAVVLDLRSTPLIQHRIDRAESLTEALFAAIVLADDRAVAETWAAGRRVWDRDRGPTHRDRVAA
ncbi:MAG TPA: amidohydrolase family protein, partial [Thermohalobaculum sp.]|nr:amidohydrolase family protein [Thermohalobaculum sp.]